jgi:hypothetical protein
LSPLWKIKSPTINRRAPGNDTFLKVVVLRLGRFQAVKGPGMLYILPFIDNVPFVDLCSAMWWAACRRTNCSQNGN